MAALVGKSAPVGPKRANKRRYQGLVSGCYSSKNRGACVGQKLADGLSYPPRAMRAEQAAAYLSISKSLFLVLVDEEILPKPTKVPGHDVSTWDRLDLDSAYDDWKSGTGQPSENTVHKRLRELADANRKQNR
jgi:predicted DNA-binding transcriptional regulator AlpA